MLSLAPTFTALANFLQPPAAIGNPGEEANNVPQTVYLLLRYSLFSVDDVGKADIRSTMWVAILVHFSLIGNNDNTDVLPMHCGERMQIQKRMPIYMSFHLLC